MEESLSRETAGQYSPLTLAFVGDGVFDLVIRTMVTTSAGNRPVKKLHREKAAIVNAHAQAQMAEVIRPYLTDEEKGIFRRGSNAHSVTVARNQTISDYRTATGLEALCGWLYMTGQMKRLMELIEKGLTGMREAIGKEDAHGQEG